ncbi:hypothetical protein HG535_0B06400 [Zygotorulaspora mrakii]|uniref:SYO1-like TPR repeats domain-containing protein n=1 Tax=Zygotorulaspora mrakii TaxID=42260 RepID=A0A7H9AYU9_ZYGMR|nr:uncharacterized protein HG535_0B06400 [Zygotorulaspora mrakii]QLG71595.1 hypothetical protein HG535_0B06400 [Zygotorulaspora mrakii]
MGKSKKRSRASNARLNPLNGAGRSNARDSSLVTNKLQPLLKNLESAIPNERAMALASISVLCEDPQMRKLLLKQKLIHIMLSRLLSDDNTDIIVESYGLLRNLSLEEGYDVSIHLWRSEIWSSISQGFDKLIESLKALQKNEQQGEKNDKIPTESRRLLFDYADNLISLVVALSNGSDDILNEILGEDKLNCVFRVVTSLLQYGIDKLPIAVLNTILDLIYDLSSESFCFIEKISNDAFLSNFIKGLPDMMNKKTFNELSKVLIQGIYLQFLDADITYDQANSIIISVCGSIENIDLEQVEANLSSNANDDELVKTQDSKVAEKIKDYTKARTGAMMKLQSIEIAIDIMTAIIEIVASLYEDGKKKIPQTLQGTLTQFLPLIFEGLGPKFASRILIAWNNLLWLYLSLGINFFDLPGEIYKSLWTYVNALPDTDIDLKLGKLSVIWALLKTISFDSDFEKWLQQFNLSNNSDFLHSVIKNYNADMSNEDLSKEDTFELGQRYCGVFSTYALFKGQIETNRIVGQFILEQLLSQDVPQGLQTEFTNSLFEIYGDGNFDYDKPVFVSGRFLEIIEKQVIPNLKSRFKFVDKNKEPQLKSKCNECISTLDSFVQYKRNE